MEPALRRKLQLFSQHQSRIQVGEYDCFDECPFGPNVRPYHRRAIVLSCHGFLAKMFEDA